MTGWLPIERVADECGAMAWLSDRLFTTWGEWSATEEDPALRVHLAVASRRHGAHAVAWRDQLPTSPQLQGAGRIVGPAEWVGLFTELDAAGELATATRRAVACEVVIPGVVARLEALLAESGDVADAPVRRVARAQLAELHAELAEAPSTSGDPDTGLVSRLGGTGVLTARGGC